MRDLFDIPAGVTYLNCAYMSPIPNSVRDTGTEAISRKSGPWQITPQDFFTDVEICRQRFADLICASIENIALIPAVSYGMAIASRNLQELRGTDIITLAEQFPSNVYPWQSLAEQRDLNMITIRRRQDFDWTAGVLDALSAETAVVALPHCHWVDGALLDLRQIGKACRNQGAALVLDVAQSCGVVPIDVREIQPDFLVSPCYKHLLGPYSMGFLYVADKYLDGEPLEHGWITRKGSEDFTKLIDYQSEFQPGARRYDVGERSNFVLVPMASEAIRQILEWGPENISETLAEKTAQIARSVASLGLTTVAPDLRAPHYLSLTSDRGLPAELTARLAERDIYVSVRGASMRVTPHLYNNDEDVARFSSALKDLLA